MITQLFLLFAGLVVLTLGADFLVRGSASLALRLGLPPLVIGLTIVAFGTSAPELVVSIGAILQGQGDISVGNVVGSNIFNIAVILGLAAAICPIPVNAAIIRSDAPFMLGVTLVATAILWTGHMPPLAGGVFVALLVAYTLFNVRLASREEGDFADGVPSLSASRWIDLGFVIGGLLLLVLGSRLFVDSAIEIARTLGVGEAIIGLTIVAAGTSMPELATSVVAALRRQPDIAVGNVIGSNTFNLLGILGVTALVRPIEAPGIRPGDLLAMVAFAIMLLPLLATGRKLQRGEGLLLLAGYGLYLWYRWPR